MIANEWNKYIVYQINTNPPKAMHEPITRIISKQLDIKLGQFKQEELNSVLRKIKNWKAAELNEIPPEVWKTREFDDILLRHCNAVYNQNTIDRWTKEYILPFPKKGDLGLAKNYRGITIISRVAKIYHALLRNRIEHKIEKILRKNQNGFRRNRSTTSQILTICRILESVYAKNLVATILFVDFAKALDSIHKGKMEQILLAYGLPKETVAATDYFDMVAGVLQGVGELLRVGELHYWLLLTSFGSSCSHCTKWADDQHRPAGFESRLVPDLPLSFIPYPLSPL